MALHNIVKLSLQSLQAFRSLHALRSLQALRRFHKPARPFSSSTITEPLYKSPPPKLSTITEPLQKSSSLPILSTVTEPLYRSSLPRLSIPWLMLPPDVKEGLKGPTDNYLNIFDKTMVKIDRPLAHEGIPPNTSCVGSTQGWLTFSSHYDNNVFLANPYMKASCLKLRPFSGIYRSGLQCTLAGNPASKNFTLLAVDEWGNNVNCVRDDKEWEMLRGPLDSEFLLAYHRKTNSMYKSQLEQSGLLQITCWDPSVDELGENGRLYDSFIDPKVLEKHAEFKEKDPWSHEIVKYLVMGQGDGYQQRSNPNLFLVTRYVGKKDEVNSKTKDIELFSINLDRGKVESVRSLGDQALFIGTNSDPFFLSTRNCSGIKPNCVYIADDLSVYDLETKCVTPFVFREETANIRPQVFWVAPPSSV